PWVGRMRSLTPPAPSATPARLASRKQDERTRWSLGRPFGVFLFVLKLDGAVGSKHHTGLLEVGLEEGWRRLLGARLIGIARQPFSALNVTSSGVPKTVIRVTTPSAKVATNVGEPHNGASCFLVLVLGMTTPLNAGARRSESPPQRCSARRRRASAQLPAR